MQLQIKQATALATATACAFVLGASAPEVSKAATPLVGIGDNAPEMFSDPNYLKLKTKIARKIVPYDFYHHADERFEFNRWMDAAQLAGVRPLIAFNASARSPKRLPTPGAFRKSFDYVRKNYPTVRDFTVWNEANHRSQPTRQNPRRAAQYFNAVRTRCASCKIVAADVLDQSNMLTWVATFRRYAKQPKIWGLHSYTDANRNRSWKRSTSKRFVDAVSGEVWLTEVGGIVALQSVYRYNERRAAQGLRNTLRYVLADRKIKRAYIYSWYGTRQPESRKSYKWDSGLLSWNGADVRPGYYALKSWLKSHPAAIKAP